MSAVLFVGDDPSDRALFRADLDGSGLTIHDAATGREALELASRARPHLIVLEASRPGIDVGRMCRTFRDDPAVGGIPILLVLGHGDPTTVVAGLDAGADECVAKGSGPQIVRHRVLRMIQARQLANVAALNDHFVQLGRLLAGIVHEIRGPLSVIRGSAELMQAHLGVEDPGRQWLEPILRNAQILQARLESLMAGVRGKPANIAATEVGPLIREAADIFLKGHNPWGGRVTIEFDLDPQLPAVQADAGRLLQVLLSLIGNASEAVRIDEVDAHLHIRARSAGDRGRDWVKVDIEDNGPGILPEHLPRIFEPFFTTKKAGSGFGLYLASSILKEQGGSLTATNLPEGGACFSIWLAPAVVPEIDSNLSHPPPGEAVPQ